MEAGKEAIEKNAIVVIPIGTAALEQFKFESIFKKIGPNFDIRGHRFIIVNTITKVYYYAYTDAEERKKEETLFIKNHEELKNFLSTFENQTDKIIIPIPLAGQRIHELKNLLENVNVGQTFNIFEHELMLVDYKYKTYTFLKKEEVDPTSLSVKHIAELEALDEWIKSKESKSNNLAEIQTEIRRILIEYRNEEYGDLIVEELSDVINKVEINPEKLKELGYYHQSKVYTEKETKELIWKSKEYFLIRSNVPYRHLSIGFRRWFNSVKKV